MAVDDSGEVAGQKDEKIWIELSIIIMKIILLKISGVAGRCNKL